MILTIFYLSLPSITTVLISRVTLNLRTTVYGPARVSRRTYQDIILSDFETKSGLNPPSNADLSLPIASSLDRSLRSASDDGSDHASGHIKSELAWTRWSQCKGEEGCAPRSRSSVSSEGDEDADEDDASLGEKACSRSIMDHEMVREEPRGRYADGGGGGPS